MPSAAEPIERSQSPRGRPKQLSMKGLAEYMIAGPSRQRAILRQHKYPAIDEARGWILYYREARDRIAAFHGARERPAWLVSQAETLEMLAAHSIGQTRVRLANNARALASYAEHFGGREFEILEEIALGVDYADVHVSAVPDLHVMEKGQEKIIRVDFSKDPLDERLVKIVAHILFEASEQAGLGLPGSGVLVFEVPRGAEHRGSPLGPRTRRNIEAACDTISAIWDSL